MEVAGANRRWRCPFRYRGSRRESAVAQLFSLGGKTHMKIFIHLICLSLLLCSSGCITSKTVDRAQGNVSAMHKDDKGAPVYDKRPEPGYYCLLPLTVAADVATSPIQIPVWLYLKITLDWNGWKD